MKTGNGAVRLPALLAALLGVAAISAFAQGQPDESWWHNPVYPDAGSSVAAAIAAAEFPAAAQSRALELFISSNLAEGDAPGLAAGVVREVFDDLILTHAATHLDRPFTRDAFRSVVPKIPAERRRTVRLLRIFGFPDLDGLVYLRLVDHVGEFAGMTTEDGARIGGVAIFCRYIVLPLVNFTPGELDHISRSAPDRANTVARLFSDSHRNTLSTLRHELVHVHANSALGYPAYLTRTANPTWFAEGAATFLGDNPRAMLSLEYRHFQDQFVFLAGRYGVARMARFFRDALADKDVEKALARNFGLADAEALAAATERWSRLRTNLGLALTMAFIALLILSFGRRRFPTRAVLWLLICVAAVGWVLLGYAEDFQAARGGPVAVMAFKVLAFALAAAAAWRAWRSLHAFRTGHRGFRRATV